MAQMTVIYVLACPFASQYFTSLSSYHIGVLIVIAERTISSPVRREVFTVADQRILALIESKLKKKDMS